MIARILVIDDEEDMCDIARICLQVINGWHVMTTTSGYEGIAIAAAQQPDAILLDAKMPGINGLETLKQLRENPLTQNIPVVMLTATVKVATQQEYMQGGAKAVLLKPFDPTTLAQQIEQALGWDSMNQP